MDLVQQKAIRMEHVVFKGNVKELDLFILEKAGSREDPIVPSAIVWIRMRRRCTPFSEVQRERRKLREIMEMKEIKVTDSMEG